MIKMSNNDDSDNISRPRKHWFFYFCNIFSTAHKDEFTLTLLEVDCPECLERLKKGYK